MRIGSAPDHTFPPSTESHHQALAAKNVQRGLAAKIQELSGTFRKKQRVYLEKLQGHAIKNQDLLVASGAISLKGSEGLSAVDEDVAAATASRNQVLDQELVTPDTDMDLRSRDRELTEIAKSIASLAELFKDLGALVIDQGTLLDSVEYNIEQTAVQMEDAVKELDVATRYVVGSVLRFAGKDGTHDLVFFFFLFSSFLLPTSLIDIIDPPHLPSPIPHLPRLFPSSTILSSHLQIPEEHRPPEMHLPPPPGHLRPHPRPHLQAQTLVVAWRVTRSWSRAYVSCDTDPTGG
ncbi:hypothetical protein EIP91_011700 [Steccherinum ochraceum]|uniref:t-SNARE coiled-coil homology domain-containing protein n=1 Tax=Steccherinum ochraceum TaxID=92696 RepID=A0A4R0RVG3_9APHY|nr:hypothetical protein EIP91_011700 [Steccherinum ochraceum]